MGFECIYVWDVTNNNWNKMGISWDIYIYIIYKIHVERGHLIWGSINTMAITCECHGI